MKLSEKQQQWLFIAIAVLLGLSVVGYRAYTALLPAASTYIAEKIPESVYQTIGESSLESFDESEFLPSKLASEQQESVRTSYQELLKNLSLSIEDYPLHFRYWDDQMNAFALMDGSIIVTDSLVAKLGTEQQLMAVLLHEVGHVQHNHLMENTIRVSLFYITMSLMFGDVGVVSDLLIEGSTLGLNLSYSRDFEKEADAYAAQKLEELYGSNEAMIEALEILYEQNDLETFHWASTHPTFAERKTSIENLAND